jgi:hypothetical protein
MAELPPAPPGITVWQNADNGFAVAQVHYTADPEKRSAAWKAKASRGMPPRGWLREYEINFATPQGEPVFPEFQAGDMVRDVRVLPGARLLRFWDFGNVAPVCLYCQLDPWGRLVQHDETVLDHANLEILIDVVLDRSPLVLGAPALACYDAGDPAGETMTDLGQVQGELLKRGILLNTLRATGSSYTALKQRLMRRVLVNGVQSPAFLIHPRCATTIEALSGAFHLKPNGQPSPVHPWKDVCDALRYGNDNLLGARSDHFAAMQKMAAIDRAW